MKRVLLLAAAHAATVALGCGMSPHYPGGPSSAYKLAPAQEAAPSPVAQQAHRGGLAEQSRAMDGLYENGPGGKLDSWSAGKKREPKDQAKQLEGGSGELQAGAEKAEQATTEKAPLVVYSGFLKLQVKRLIAASDRITEVTEGAGGYVESLSSQVVVVRVPAARFEELMDEFAKLGELLSRSVEALDVTEQFTDLNTRLAVAKEARGRLMRLLEAVQDVKERLRILEEIQRLSEQIESMESSLGTLQGLLDYFTITIELEPVLDRKGASPHRSPFAWVRNLAAHRATLGGDRDELELPAPAGFVQFTKHDRYLAQAADRSLLRAGVVANEPFGDAAFWSEAVDFELQGRDEHPVAQGDAGPMLYRIYRNRDLKPRYYLVGVHVQGEQLYVVEAFFPNEEAFTRHRDAVVAALRSFQAR